MHLHKYMYCGLLAVTLAIPQRAVLAQTAAPPSVEASAGDRQVLIKEDLFTVSPVLETELSSDTAVPVELQFNARPNTTESVDISGIMAEGFTRTVNVNGEEIAQVVVTRLKKDTNFVDLEANDFTSQFGVDSKRLLPTTAISVNGDEAEFVQAVAQLSAKEETDESSSQDDRETTSTEGASVDSEGGSANENPVAGGYETPNRLAQDEEEEEREPNLSFNVTTDGCEPIIDLAGGTVRQTSMSETLEDGVVTETDACSPNGVVWNIQKNYEVCEDIVDQANLVARPQYVSYYNDDNGARYDLAGCQPDTSVSFAITESDDACAPELDFDREVVSLMSQLTYRNRSGSEVVVQSCEGTGDTIDMERSYGECDELVDSTKGVAYQQYKLVYADDQGSVHTVRQCAPDESDGFDFQRSYDECNIDIDLEARISRPQYALFYQDLTGTKQVVTQCQPDTDKRFVIEESFASCTDIVDIHAGYATPQYRLFYEDDGGVQVVVQECKPSGDQTYQISELDTGCDDYVDLTNGLAYPQFTLSYTNNANKKEIVRECAPSEDTSYPLVKSYDGCDVVADLEALEARPEFRWSYLDATLKQIHVTECAPDEETAFVIEERQNCTFDFDFDTGVATVNTSLVYTNGDDVEVSARECGPSQTIDPIRMTADTSNCSLQHNYGSGVSTEMAMWTYEYDGQLFQASPCITTDATYTHAQVFEKNGIDVCTPIVDLANGQAARQYRTEITVDGREEVIAGCQPDESNMLGIEATTDGCEDAASFDHDLAAGVSYGRERFYYNVPGQGRVYVTGCQRNDQTFTHSVSPNGWKNNDSTLRSQQLVDVSIKVNGAAYQIATSYLQPGTSEVAYSFLRNQDDADYASKYYDGCNEMIPTKRTKLYTRPDGSTYSLPSGSGTTINNGDKCVRSVETQTLGNRKIWVAGKGYTHRIRDGNGNLFYAGNGCNSGGKTFSGNGPYSHVSSSGPSTGCNHPSNEVRMYHEVQERSKIVYPDGSVIYGDWQSTGWTT
ncbi:MAG: hypothetical protein K5905_00755 [Roseibium sp.]|uniref:hypothetical protein n=1 Tax=Roseibium sp. TaxID=1936156 RepID=UPI00262D4637|nr:hypothetical protein [Roseibium sp.]MCV0423977.1 hypothetical protein [Roseibium sp.]